MVEFEDVWGRQLRAGPETMAHIADRHPEMTTGMIAATLADPDEVRRSNHHPDANLFYRRAKSGKFHCVVVKNCPDGVFVSTAMTTRKPKRGELIHVKKEKNIHLL